MKLLYLTNKTNYSKSFSQLLKKAGYAVDDIFDHEIGFDMALFGAYDLIILDSLLPGSHGISFINELRSLGIDTPLIFLSANENIQAMVDCLDAGADDYLVKPFSNELLLARLRALSRRKDKQIFDSELKVTGLALNVQKRRVVTENNVIKLSVKEALLLETLMLNCGNVVTKEHIFEKLWGSNSIKEFANVDLYICYLRKKIGASQIKTVRSIGYYIENK